MCVEGNTSSQKIYGQSHKYICEERMMVDLVRGWRSIEVSRGDVEGD